MKVWFMALLVLFVTACQPLTEMRKDEIITAVGTASISTQRGDTDEEKRVRAMRASKVEAYRELAEQVYGLRISGLTGVDDQSLGEDRSNGAVDGIIRGAEVVRSYPVGDSYVTEMRLDLKKMTKMKSFGESYNVPRNEQIIY